MKFISWNVNGIRASLKNGFLDFLNNENPDILCLQEIKAQEDTYPEELKNVNNYNFYINPAEKRGYSGTVIYSKIKPINIVYGIKSSEFDNEGRVITLEFEKFYLVNVYTPNSGRDLKRLEFRNSWDKKFLEYVKNIEKNKPVMICGDLNVAHCEIDIKNYQSNKTTKTKPGNAGFTDTERNNFSKFLDSDFIDTFRYLYPSEIKYSWWSYMFNSRTNNSGWRIDYFCISSILKDNLEDAFILNEVFGSDHCPVGIKINI
jgi:exodeoxyribonuclease-3